MIKYFLVIQLVIYGIYCQNTNSKPTIQRSQNCLRRDCHPETGDLLIGRTKFLHASSTCGLEVPERYCVLGETNEQTTKCSVCDSTQPYDPQENIESHRIENIVSIKPGDRYNRWWQSENGRQDVYIQFDLEAEFLFTHLIMTFKTFRPAAMLIEKSSDFGQSWKTYAYFAYNCEEVFPGRPTGIPKTIGDVYCETRYSSPIPTTRGEIVFRILHPSLTQNQDPFSSEIQDLLKITNLRINFTKLHTFGDNLLDDRQEIKEKYYYSLFEMVIRGSCLCYGHANKCIQVEGVQYDDDTRGMVHGQCQCTHNTAGTNCEQCLPLFNDRPWKPAFSGEKNECKKCECNNHARKCHFNQTLFDESGGVSGGVCDNCEHNTIGIHCELCKANHWRDPTRNINDTSTCRPCQCDARGSLNDAKCDTHTDEEAGLVAGKCHCKSLVEGAHCDRCQNGYFNLSKENPEGCEPCACNLIGTAGNLGCDKVNGLCSCKQFVAGRACDQCAPGYYGLSEDDPNGCKPCDCSVGGAYDNACDAETGQCKCRPNMTGRRCDKPETGFFCPGLTFFTFEAEYAKKLDQRTQDVIRPIYDEGRTTWTGPGFVRIYEGASLEFIVDNIQNAGKYEVAIRYEQIATEGWENLLMTLVREDQPSDGPCAGASIEEARTIRLPPNQLHRLVSPGFCLEPKKTYKFIFEFQRFTIPLHREASILLDSIILVPVVESLEMFQGPDGEKLLSEYQYWGCRDAQISPYRYPMAEQCAKFVCNIGVSTIGALTCQCNPTGSLSNMCDENGGACKCKPNVVGRKCDQCAPATWGFGPNGCQACNCNSGGAKNNFCDVETGVCDCYDKIEGTKCDKCVTNHWQFPSCVPCTCNGFADSCNQTTGECIECKDFTTGFYCEKCVDGYYGKPTAGIACKECMCPGGSTGNKFAATCFYDQRFDTVVCSCKPGYVGAKCEKCDINYYGNPLEIGGSCKQCECNGNIDTNNPESCDQANGKCRNCLYNTAGDHCEHCEYGFYGNASNHECRPCNCNEYGTVNNTHMNCDRETGQCQCLPNVIGKHCDSCKSDHYGIMSRTGCTDCDCDVEGTLNGTTACDINSGQCPCQQSRGGRTCSDCESGYWGDPNDKCNRCECSGIGSVNHICDKLTGKCNCIEGIAGYNCDRCDRGTFGQIPYCSKCGQCFDDWTVIINDIKGQLNKLEDDAANIAVANASPIKDFTVQYQTIEERLNDVRRIINSTAVNDIEIKRLRDQLAALEKELAQKKNIKKKYINIEQWTEANPAATLENATKEYDYFNDEMDKLIAEANSVKESRTSGAIDSILNSKKASDASESTTELYKRRVESDFKPTVDQLKKMLDGYNDEFEKTDEKLRTILDDATRNVSDAYNSISSLNKEVCGAATSESEICDKNCGGATCKKCGGSGCNGLADAYENVIAVRKQFEDLYSQQESVFKRLLTMWHNSSSMLKLSNNELVSLIAHANNSLNSIHNKRNELNNLIESIKNFTIENSDLPKKIEQDCNTIIGSTHKVTNEELEQTLKTINELAANIDVNTIRQDANQDFNDANAIKARAHQKAQYLNGTYADLNNTNTLIQNKKAKIEEVEKSLDNLTMQNKNIKENVAQSKENIDKVKNVVDEINKSIDDLRKSVDYDKEANDQAKTDSLKAKAKESATKYSHTKKLLDELEEKVKALTEKLKSEGEGDDREQHASLVESLINLDASIRAKKEVIEQRQNRLQALKMENEKAKNKIETLKKTVNDLRSKTSSLQREIFQTRGYYEGCQ